MKLFKSKKSRTLLAVLLAFVIAFGSGDFHIEVYAYTARAAVVTCDPGYTVTFRKGPSTSTTALEKLNPETPVTVIDETNASDGWLWYKVEYKSQTGYIRSDLIRFTGGEVSTAAQTGVVNGITVNVRDRAGTSGTKVLCVVNPGQAVEIIGQTTEGNDLWYNVNLTLSGKSYTGWIFAEFVTVNSTSDAPVTDGDFSQQMLNAGFPASYIPALAQLHANHPNWTFQPVKTGLDWNTVISEESKIGRNLIQNSFDDSRKSTASGAYNWNTNTWAIYDGKVWVAANSNYISYCMDPRNFLNETYIFMFEGLSYSNTHSLSGVNSILSGTFMANNVTDTDGSTLNYAQTLMNIGKAVGVSPYHLASRLRQEQGSGKSGLISGNYPGYQGYFNYFNFGAYSTSAGTVEQNGLAYAKRQGWNSRYKSIYGGAQMIGSSYIAKGQDTIYFEKFNVVNTNSLYGHQYMTNVMAPMSESINAAKGYSDKNQAFNFRIPVYNNMPASAVGYSDTGNPNNYLKSLSVSGVNLTPTFTGATTNYSVVVGSGVSSVTIAASPIASTSSVSGIGNVSLKTGNNVFNINCTAQNGDVKTYTINIARQAAADNTGSDNNNSYSVTSSVYTIGTYVTGIQPKTNASAFLSNMNASGCTMKVLSSNGNENTGIVGTGNKLAIYVNGELKKVYDIVIYGDVSGDGAISMSDLVKINRHLLGISRLAGINLEAGDSNRRGDGVSMSDLVIVNRHILGLTRITQ